MQRSVMCDTARSMNNACVAARLFLDAGGVHTAFRVSFRSIYLMIKSKGFVYGLTAAAATRTALCKLVNRAFVFLVAMIYHNQVKRVTW